VTQYRSDATPDVTGVPRHDPGGFRRRRCCRVGADSDEDFHVYTDAPRLLLTKQRLRLLQREHERGTTRWQQFDALISGGAPLPEPGFASALYYQIAKDPAAGRRAIEWALSAAAACGVAERSASDGSDFRLCGPLDVEGPSRQARRKNRACDWCCACGGSGKDVLMQDARALATIAIADRLADHGNAILSGIVQQWWRARC